MAVDEFRCRICCFSEMEVVCSIPDVALGDDLHLGSEESLCAVGYDVNVYKCLKCGHWQQDEMVPKDLIWKQYNYKSASALGLLTHFAEIRDLVFQVGALSSINTMLDIGANDGSFLSTFQSSIPIRVGVDPAENVVLEANQNGHAVLKGYWGTETSIFLRNCFGKFDLISALNVFGHCHDLKTFINEVAKSLSDKGVFIFEAQYLIDIIQKTLIPSLFHEHISHHHLSPLIDLFAEFDLEVFFAKRYRVQNGAFIAMVGHKGRHAIHDSVPAMLDAELEFFVPDLNFRERLEQDTANIRQKIEIEINRSDKLLGRRPKIVGFGAARSATVIIEILGLQNELSLIYDEHPDKKDRYFPKTNILISDDEKRLVDADIVVNLAWSHATTLLPRLRSICSVNTVILNPFPFMRG